MSEISEAMQQQAIVDKADYAVLQLANADKGQFGIQLGYPMAAESQELQYAFDRCIDNDWFTLVDISAVTVGEHSGYLRIFKLTPAGWARRRELERKLAKTPSGIFDKEPGDA